MTISLKAEAIMSVSEFSEEKFGGNRTFIRGIDTIPASGATIYPGDVLSLTDVVLSGWYTEHKACAKFNRSLCTYLCKEFCTLCNSGSSASLLAVKGCNELYTSGDYVITCATGFPTTVAPIYQTGMIPLYVDIDPETLAPSKVDIERAFELYKNKTGGIILAHTLGFPFDESDLWMMKAGQWLVTDCCDALGAQTFYDDGWHPVGSFSNAMTLSFFPAHQITTAEGGAVLTDDTELHRVIESLSNWGRDCWCLPGQSNTCGKRFKVECDTLPEGWDHKYTFTQIGYNLKMTEFQAALGDSQLSRFDNALQKRQENFSYLRKLLDPFREYLQFVVVPEWSKPSPFGFPVIVRDDVPFTANELIQHLEKRKISTRRMFGGNLTRQPAFANLPYKTVSNLAGSNKIMNDGFWIGCHDALRKEHLDYMVEVFYEFFDERALK